MYLQITKRVSETSSAVQPILDLENGGRIRKPDPYHCGCLCPQYRDRQFDNLLRESKPPDCHLQPCHEKLVDWPGHHQQTSLCRPFNYRSRSARRRSHSTRYGLVSCNYFHIRSIVGGIDSLTVAMILHCCPRTRDSKLMGPTLVSFWILTPLLESANNNNSALVPPARRRSRMDTRPRTIRMGLHRAPRRPEHRPLPRLPRSSRSHRHHGRSDRA